MKLHYVDLTIIILYLLTCLIIGLYRNTKIKNLHQFALGYKNISSTALICTLFASVTGAGSTLGVAEKAYLFGIIFVIRQLFEPVGWLITSYIITPSIEKFKGCLSISEIVYRFYGTPGRWITSSASIFLSMSLLTIQATAMGYLFHYFLDIIPFYGMLIGYTILTAYSMLGGIKAVIVTEVFKFFLFFTIVPISYLFASTKVGGFTNLINILPETYSQFSFTRENISLIIMLVFYFIFPRFEAPFIQRCLIAQNAKQLRSCFKHIALLSIPFSLSFCTIAYVVKGYAPDISSKEVVFYYIEHYLPIGLQGIMVAGLFATMMSLAESQVSSASVILVNDVIRQLFPKLSNTSQLLLLRSFILILSTASIALVTTTRDLLNIAWLAFNFYDPIISIPLTAGFLGFRTSHLSFIANTVCAILFTLIGRVYAGEFAITSFCFGISGSAIGFFGAHYIQKILGTISVTVRSEYTFQSLLSIRSHIRNSVNNIVNQFKKKPLNVKYKEFGIFTLSSYFIYSFYLCFFNYYERLLYLVIIGYFLCLILLAREITFAPKFLRKHLYLYWNVTVTYCLPFVSSYMLFASKGDDFWIINGIFAAISLHFFVDAVKYLILYSIGTTCAFVLFMLTDYSDHSLIIALGSVAYVVLFILLTSLLFLRQREKEYEEQVETMHIFGGAIAHEVKSPLATLNMCAQQLDILINKAIDNKIRDDGSLNLKKNEVDLLIELGNALKMISKGGVKTVENLLTSLKSNVIASDKETYKISQAINLAIKELSSLHNLDNKLEVNILQDFSFYGSLHYVKHVLFNLFTNAYRYGGQDVYITITTEDNILSFKDNGKGIAEKDLPYIFDKFYTQGRTGTGIGLSFCKMVMEDMNGTIECRSKTGQFTEFIIVFPSLAEDVA